jgi:hypothetical protein
LALLVVRVLPVEQSIGFQSTWICGKVLCNATAQGGSLLQYKDSIGMLQDGRKHSASVEDRRLHAALQMSKLERGRMVVQSEQPK